MFFTYIIKNKKSGKYYIGQTKNLDERLERHNQGRSRFTKRKSKGEWEIAYKKDFKTKKQAIIFESYIKKQKSKIFIKKLINNHSGMEE